ncbi:pyrimidine reductase family protein [Amycolatopsis rhizosphaerae]|uniref:Pyrimidine reductase family protein n=1 Tax=Amycolatopsis rhizosphaerae TaxID=2053003 RepID=A0A558B7K5_9PSEU|nr:pyrimidine reductase family protein [Amycolatopsis rhizosphaerae]TVT32472.1 pyrimidine reductase family protein [Amycolatopsis rhizosphaerae]
MRMLWPLQRDDVTDADLERLYDYPSGLDRPWVQVNFVSSADGAVTADGVSEGLSHPADKRVFLMGRDLADVILVGGGTVREEGYRGARSTAERQERRRRLGLSPIPPIAVVSGSARLDPASPLFTDTTVPPIVITTESAPEERRAALAEAGADLLVAGEKMIDLTAALGGLSRRGLRRIDCEGGPHLFGELIAENLVDQLCLTVAPVLAGAGAGRIAMGRTAGGIQRLDLASVLYEDGFTLLRYRKRD